MVRATGGFLKIIPTIIPAGQRTELQAVDLCEFVGDVIDKVLRVGGCVSETLDQGFGLVDGTNAVHALTQPLQHEVGITTRQTVGEIWEGLAQGVIDLRTIQVAKRVGGEIPETTCPMNIL